MVVWNILNLWGKHLMLMTPIHVLHVLITWDVIYKSQRNNPMRHDLIYLCPEHNSQRNTWWFIYFFIFSHIIFSSFTISFMVIIAICMLWTESGCKFVFTGQRDVRYLVSLSMSVSTWICTWCAIAIYHWSTSPRQRPWTIRSRKCMPQIVRARATNLAASIARSIWRTR